MSEPARQEGRGPLHSDRGITRISDGVVEQLAGMAASEIDGVHMGGQTSRTAGSVLGGITGSSGTRRGVTVEVGQVEAALDLTMGLTYGRNIVETTEAVRRNVRARVESLTGLTVTELNITINDIVFPEDAPVRGYGSVREPEGPSEEPLPEGPTRRETPPEETTTRRGPAGDETAELDISEDDRRRR